MRLLGVDFGAKRIGLAVAESDPAVVTPRKPITPTGTLKKDALMLNEIAQKEEVAAIVLGLPYHEEANDGGKMQRVCHMLASELRGLGQTVHLVDESLTSVQAEERLVLAGLKAAARKQQRDGEAAALILERYLDRGP